jgi:hypothetical protein
MNEQQPCITLVTKLVEDVGVKDKNALHGMTRFQCVV